MQVACRSGEDKQTDSSPEKEHKSGEILIFNSVRPNLDFWPSEL